MDKRTNCSGHVMYHLRRVGPPASCPGVVDVMDFYKVTSMIGRNGAVVDFYLNSNNDIQSKSLSRQHARVVRLDNNQHKLCDDSLNGVFVNHVKILGSVILQEGDLVTFGHMSGNKLAAGTRIRQPDSEYQFIFEKCSCPIKSPEKTKKKFAVPKSPKARAAQRRRERNVTQTVTQADLKNLRLQTTPAQTQVEIASGSTCTPPAEFSSTDIPPGQSSSSEDGLCDTYHTETETTAKDESSTLGSAPSQEGSEVTSSPNLETSPKKPQALEAANECGNCQDLQTVSANNGENPPELHVHVPPESEAVSDTLGNTDVLKTSMETRVDAQSPSSDSSQIGSVPNRSFDGQQNTGENVGHTEVKNPVAEEFPSSSVEKSADVEKDQEMMSESSNVDNDNARVVSFDGHYISFNIKSPTSSSSEGGESRTPESESRLQENLASNGATLQNGSSANGLEIQDTHTVMEVQESAKEDDVVYVMDIRQPAEGSGLQEGSIIGGNVTETVGRSETGHEIINDEIPESSSSYDVKKSCGQDHSEAMETSTSELSGQGHIENMEATGGQQEGQNDVKVEASGSEQPGQGHETSTVEKHFIECDLTDSVKRDDNTENFEVKEFVTSSNRIHNSETEVKVANENNGRVNMVVCQNTANIDQEETSELHRVDSGESHLSDKAFDSVENETRTDLPSGSSTVPHTDISRHDNETDDSSACVLESTKVFETEEQNSLPLESTVNSLNEHDETCEYLSVGSRELNATESPELKLELSETDQNELDKTRDNLSSSLDLDKVQNSTAPCVPLVMEFDDFTAGHSTEKEESHLSKTVCILEEDTSNHDVRQHPMDGVTEQVTINEVSGNKDSKSLSLSEDNEPCLVTATDHDRTQCVAVTEDKQMNDTVHEDGHDQTELSSIQVERNGVLDSSKMEETEETNGKDSEKEDEDTSAEVIEPDNGVSDVCEGKGANSLMNEEVGIKDSNQEEKDESEDVVVDHPSAVHASNVTRTTFMLSDSIDFGIEDVSGERNEDNDSEDHIVAEQSEQEKTHEDETEDMDTNESKYLCDQLTTEKARCSSRVSSSGSEETLSQKYGKLVEKMQVSREVGECLDAMVEKIELTELDRAQIHRGSVETLQLPEELGTGASLYTQPESTVQESSQSSLDLKEQILEDESKSDFSSPSKSEDEHMNGDDQQVPLQTEEVVQCEGLNATEGQGSNVVASEHVDLPGIPGTGDIDDIESFVQIEVEKNEQHVVEENQKELAEISEPGIEKVDFQKEKHSRVEKSEKILTDSHVTQDDTTNPQSPRSIEENGDVNEAVKTNKEVLMVKNVQNENYLDSTMSEREVCTDSQQSSLKAENFEIYIDNQELQSDSEGNTATKENQELQSDSEGNTATKENQELQSDNQELQSDKQELQSDKQELQSDNEKLQSDIEGNTATKENQELQSDSQELQSDNQELQSDIKELQSDNQELQSDCEGNTATKANFSGPVETNRMKCPESALPVKQEMNMEVDDGELKREVDVSILQPVVGEERVITVMLSDEEDVGEGDEDILDMQTQADNQMEELNDLAELDLKREVPIASDSVMDVEVCNDIGNVCTVEDLVSVDKEYVDDEAKPVQQGSSLGGEREDTLDRYQGAVTVACDTCKSNRDTLTIENEYCEEDQQSVIKSSVLEGQLQGRVLNRVDSMCSVQLGSLDASVQINSNAMISVGGVDQGEEIKAIPAVVKKSMSAESDGSSSRVSASDILYEWTVDPNNMQGSSESCMDSSNTVSSSMDSMFKDTSDSVTVKCVENLDSENLVSSSSYSPNEEATSNAGRTAPGDITITNCSKTLEELNGTCSIESEVTSGLDCTYKRPVSVQNESTSIISESSERRPDVLQDAEVSVEEHACSDNAIVEDMKESCSFKVCEEDKSSVPEECSLSRKRRLSDCEECIEHSVRKRHCDDDSQQKGSAVRKIIEQFFTIRSTYYERRRHNSRQQLRKDLVSGLVHNFFKRQKIISTSATEEQPNKAPCERILTETFPDRYEGVMDVSKDAEAETSEGSPSNMKTPDIHRYEKPVESDPNRYTKVNQLSANKMDSEVQKTMKDIIKECRSDHGDVDVNLNRLQSDAVSVDIIRRKSLETEKGEDLENSGSSDRESTPSLHAESVEMVTSEREANVLLDGHSLVKSMEGDGQELSSGSNCAAANNMQDDYEKHRFENSLSQVMEKNTESYEEQKNSGKNEARGRNVDEKTEEMKQYGLVISEEVNHELIEHKNSNSQTSTLCQNNPPSLEQQLLFGLNIEQLIQNFQKCSSQLDNSVPVILKEGNITVVIGIPRGGVAKATGTDTQKQCCDAETQVTSMEIDLETSANDTSNFILHSSEDTCTETKNADEVHDVDWTQNSTASKEKRNSADSLLSKYDTAVVEKCVESHQDDSSSTNDSHNIAIENFDGFTAVAGKQMPCERMNSSESSCSRESESILGNNADNGSAVMSNKQLPCERSNSSEISCSREREPLLGRKENDFSAVKPRKQISSDRSISSESHDSRESESILGYAVVPFDKNNICITRNDQESIMSKPIMETSRPLESGRISRNCSDSFSSVTEMPGTLQEVGGSFDCENTPEPVVLESSHDLVQSFIQEDKNAYSDSSIEIISMSSSPEESFVEYPSCCPVKQKRSISSTKQNIESRNCDVENRGNSDEIKMQKEKGKRTPEKKYVKEATNSTGKSNTSGRMSLRKRTRKQLSDSDTSERTSKRSNSTVSDVDDIVGNSESTFVSDHGGGEVTHDDLTDCVTENSDGTVCKEHTDNWTPGNSHQTEKTDLEESDSINNLQQSIGENVKTRRRGKGRRGQNVKKTDQIFGSKSNKGRKTITRGRSLVTKSSDSDGGSIVSSKKRSSQRLKSSDENSEEKDIRKSEHLESCSSLEDLEMELSQRASQMKSKLPSFDGNSSPESRTCDQNLETSMFPSNLIFEDIVISDSSDSDLPEVKFLCYESPKVKIPHPLKMEHNTPKKELPSSSESQSSLQEKVPSTRNRKLMKKPCVKNERTEKPARESTKKSVKRRTPRKRSEIPVPKQNTKQDWSGSDIMIISGDSESETEFVLTKTNRENLKKEGDCQSDDDEIFTIKKKKSVKDQAETISKKDKRHVQQKSSKRKNNRSGCKPEVKGQGRQRKDSSDSSDDFQQLTLHEVQDDSVPKGHSVEDIFDSERQHNGGGGHDRRGNSKKEDRGNSKKEDKGNSNKEEGDEDMEAPDCMEGNISEEFSDQDFQDDIVPDTQEDEDDNATNLLPLHVSPSTSPSQSQAMSPVIPRAVTPALTNINQSEQSADQSAMFERDMAVIRPRPAHEHRDSDDNEDVQSDDTINYSKITSGNETPKKTESGQINNSAEACGSQDYSKTADTVETAGKAAFTDLCTTNKPGPSESLDGPMNTGLILEMPKGFEESDSDDLSDMDFSQMSTAKTRAAKNVAMVRASFDDDDDDFVSPVVDMSALYSDNDNNGDEKDKAGVDDENPYVDEGGDNFYNVRSPFNRNSDSDGDDSEAVSIKRLKKRKLINEFSSPAKKTCREIVTLDMEIHTQCQAVQEFSSTQFEDATEKLSEGQSPSKKSKARLLIEKFRAKKRKREEEEKGSPEREASTASSQETPGELPGAGAPRRQILRMDQNKDNAEAHIAKAKELLQRLKAAFNSNPQLNGHPRIMQWRKDLQDLDSKAVLPRTVIAVVGDTGAGKSSLMNALLDQLDVLPTSGMRACTAVVVEVVNNTINKNYEADITFLSKEEWHSELRLLLKDLTDSEGKVKKGTPDPKSEAGVAFLKIKAVYGRIDRFEALTRLTPVTRWLDRTKTISSHDPVSFRNSIDRYIETDDPGVGGQYWPIVRQVRIRLPDCDVCSSGAVLVDLPGVRDSNAARDKIARDYLKKCTVVWVASSIHRAIDDKTAKDLLGENFRRQLLMDGQYGSIAFICTKADIIKPTEIIRGLKLQKEVEPFEKQLEQLEVEKSQLEESITDNQRCIKSMLKEKKKLQKELEELREVMSEAEVTDLESQEFTELQQEKEEKESTLAEHEENLAKYEKEKNEAERRCMRIDREKNKVRKELSAFCARKRNEYSKVQIKTDFKAGLREMKRRAGMTNADNDDEEDDDDLYNSDDDDEVIGSSADNLKVFCVSSTEYQKMRNLLTNDGPPAVFNTEEETQIPALREYVHQMTAVRRKQGVERLLQQLAQYVSDINNYILEDGTKCKDTRRSMKDAIQYRSSRLMRQFNPVMERLLTDLRDAFVGQISPKVDEGVMAANKSANETVAKWGSKQNKENKREGGLHFSTYRATIRRQGVFTSPSYGPVNFNEDLSAPMYTCLSIVWDKVFSGVLWKHLDRCKTMLLYTLKTFVSELCQELHALGVAAARTERVTQQILDSSSNKLSEMISFLKEFVTEQQREINRILTPTVQENLSNIYESCCMESGTGMFARIKDKMTSGVDSSRFIMFDEASKKLLFDLDQLQDHIVNHVRKVCDEICMMLQTTFEPLWEAPRNTKVLKETLCKDVKASATSMKELLEEANVKLPAVAANHHPTDNLSHPASTTSMSSGAGAVALHGKGPQVFTTAYQGIQKMVTDSLGIPQNVTLEEVKSSYVTDILKELKQEPGETTSVTPLSAVHVKKEWIANGSGGETWETTHSTNLHHPHICSSKHGSTSSRQPMVLSTVPSSVYHSQTNSRPMKSILPNQLSVGAILPTLGHTKASLTNAKPNGNVQGNVLNSMSYRVVETPVQPGRIIRVVQPSTAVPASTMTVPVHTGAKVPPSSAAMSNVHVSGSKKNSRGKPSSQTAVSAGPSVVVGGPRAIVATPPVAQTVEVNSSSPRTRLAPTSTSSTTAGKSPLTKALGLELLTKLKDKAKSLGLTAKPKTPEKNKPSSQDGKSPTPLFTKSKRLSLSQSRSSSPLQLKKNASCQPSGPVQVKTEPLDDFGPAAKKPRKINNTGIVDLTLESDDEN